MKLIEGAIAWAGGKILEGLFGSYSAANAHLQEIIRAELRGEALRRAAALMESLTIRIGQYQNGGGIDRLQLANKDAEDLLADLRSLGVLAFHNYHHAVGLTVIVLQDRFAVTNNEGEKKNIREALERGISHLPQLHAQLLQAAESRVGPAWARPTISRRGLCCGLLVGR